MILTKKGGLLTHPLLSLSSNNMRIQSWRERIAALSSSLPPPVVVVVVVVVVAAAAALNQSTSSYLL
jgi:hypothetical protein